MNINLEPEFLIPLIICLLALLPVAFPSLRSKGDDTKFGASHLAIIYLICLVLVSIGFLGMHCLTVMQIDNSDRLILISSILAVACLDQFIDLSPIKSTTKLNLITRLVYFNLILNLIIPIWQISRNIMPFAITSQANIMNSINIVLILTLLVTITTNWSLQRNAAQISQL